MKREQLIEKALKRLVLASRFPHCEQAHHGPGQYHDSDMACPVEREYNEALEQAERALEGRKPRLGRGGI